MADDHAPGRPEAFDIQTDEGLEAYLLDLDTRRPVPERLRYPETDEAYDRMIAEADADPRTVPAEKVRAWLESLGTASPLPIPEPE